jgi:peptide deformylase
MALSILQVGEAILRQPTRALTVPEIHSSTIQQLIAAMQQTMYEAPGVGLAAPQIGEPLQLLVMEDRAELLQKLPSQQLIERERFPFPFQVIINPTLVVEQSQQLNFFEGCLSVDGFIGLVPRFHAVKVTGLNEKAEPIEIQAYGWQARILQHEIDHLQGKLCIDQMLPKSMMSVANYRKYWLNQPISCVCEALGIT